MTTSAVFPQNVVTPGVTAGSPGSKDAREQVARAMSRLAAVMVWAPANRANGLVAASGRSLVDLPVEAGVSVLGALEAEVMALGAARANGRALPMRVLTNGLGGRLLFGAGNHNAALTVEVRDFEGRGTGGVLADAARSYDEDDLVLVMEGAQVLGAGLSELLEALVEEPADLSLFSHADQSPSVMMVVRCGCLRGLPRLGAIDFKGRAVPEISAGHRVRVVKRSTGSGAMFEDLAGYVAALRQYHRRKQGGLAIEDGAEWQPVFSVVENGADAAPSAHLYDTVVLKGGKVEGAATVVRSLVVAGGVVKKKETKVDGVVGK